VATFAAAVLRPDGEQERLGGLVPHAEGEGLVGVTRTVCRGADRPSVHEKRRVAARNRGDEDTPRQGIVATAATSPSRRANATAFVMPADGNGPARTGVERMDRARRIPARPATEFTRPR